MTKTYNWLTPKYAIVILLFLVCVSSLTLAKFGSFANVSGVQPNVTSSSMSTPDVSWFYGSFLSGIVGFVTGFGSKILFDWFAEPKLEMATTSSTPFTIWFKAPNGTEVEARAYRVKIHNRQKRRFNTAARNCIAWLDLQSITGPGGEVLNPRMNHINYAG